MTKSTVENMTNGSLLAQIIGLNSLARLQGSSRSLALNTGVQGSILRLANKPIAKDAMTLHLGTIPRPNVQVDGLKARVSATEQAMAVPGPLAKEEEKARFLEGGHVGSLVVYVGDADVDVDAVLCREAGHAGRAGVADGDCRRAEGRDEHGVEVGVVGWPAPVGADDREAWRGGSCGEANRCPIPVRTIYRIPDTGYRPGPGPGDAG
ncbi:hypothetical protein L249_1178 [Ophiocordyceps polyrhachis-furcata BCC 54312]|uniref:Uncharacterized protein n=1 Tax=Ophiocordyceps polyrhachis-furcata BCC 54312 TaxID=1330021 RepID=A0A367LFK1_9HYPO|nr:hypothetical protein L249_1178 [Ophiocordyceps polyrhachis-furcata BCC 54312]